MITEFTVHDNLRFGRLILSSPRVQASYVQVSAIILTASRPNQLRAMAFVVAVEEAGGANNAIRIMLAVETPGVKLRRMKLSK
jgi:hypothetical protein